MSKVRAEADAAGDGGRVQIGPRLPKSLVDRLKSAAERNGRTFNKELEIAVREYLDDDDASQLPQELIQAVEEWYKENKTANGSR